MRQQPQKLGRFGLRSLAILLLGLALVVAGCEEPPQAAQEQAADNREGDHGEDNGEAEEGGEGGDESAAVVPAPETAEAVRESVQEDVDAANGERVLAQRREIIQRAVEAVAATHTAIHALDEDRPDDALSALEVATGKLEIVLAESPEMALAPISMTVREHDLLTTLEAIEEAKDEAEEALDDGRVQTARRLLAVLASELDVRVTSIPLATYPDAIRAVVPLINAGDHAEAAEALSDALRTLVVTHRTIPLPIVRAEAMLLDAAELAEREDRSPEDNTRLTELVDNATYQVRLAEALGYGTSEDYAALYEQLGEIREQTEGGQSGTGFFDRIRATIRGMRERIFGPHD